MIDLLQRFAELPPATDEGQQVAEQLAAQVAVIHGLVADDDPEVRLLAACALARLDPGEGILRNLIEGLRSADEAHQVYAAYACRCIGSVAALAVPALCEVVQQEEHDTAAYHAIQALEAIGPAATGAVPLLVEVLRDIGSDAPGNRMLHALGAAAALGAIGDRAAIPALQACLGLEGDELVEMVKEEAAEAIRRISASL